MKPFEGIRVLDLTHVLAGPFSTYQLAVLGAEVIKIESPQNQDMTRTESTVPDLTDKNYGTYFMSQNAGKKALTLNLKTEEGREIMSRLVTSADVLVQNYAGRALEKLGFGYDTCRQLNHKLIYCTISGYGRTGPKANHPAYDVVIQAFSGLMAANGSKEFGPTRVGPPMVDYGTGAQAALAISAALFQRNLTGRGQQIDVSMLDSALMLMSASLVDTIATHQAPEPHGNIHPNYAGYRTYRASDDTLMIGAWTNKQLARLFEVLGEKKEAAKVLSTPRAEISKFLGEHTRLISGHISTKSADEWEEILNSNHVPAARVRTLDETIQDPQVAIRNGIQPNPDLRFEGVPSQLPVSGFSYEHGSPSVESPPPLLGEHTTQLLKELGYSAETIEKLKGSGII